jgi:hypothetical protein
MKKTAPRVEDGGCETGRHELLWLFAYRLEPNPMIPGVWLGVIELPLQNLQRDDIGKGVTRCGIWDVMLAAVALDNRVFQWPSIHGE